MTTDIIKIWNPGEYTYEASFGFEPNLIGILHEDEEIRPCMVVVPGGGYRFVSPTEAEIVAERFASYGYNTFVFTYTTNLLDLQTLKMQPLRDIARAVRHIRAHAADFRIDPGRLAVCGFSAGAHLCGSLCVHFADVEDEAYPEISARPDAAILSYPVITSGEYAHRDSFTALLGAEATEEELAYMSLEKQVGPSTPPIFLWQTVTDELVPVENSYLMAEALKKEGIPYAHHVFGAGRHGLSLADETWVRDSYKSLHTLWPTFCLRDAAREGQIPVSPEDGRIARFMPEHAGERELSENRTVSEEVRIWPELARTWLDMQLGN